MTATTGQPTQVLASFLASLCYEDLPDEVVGRTEDYRRDHHVLGGRARPAAVERLKA